MHHSHICLWCKRSVEQLPNHALAASSQAKLDMLKLTDDQLEATTKRTIIENEHMSTELAYQSRQMEKLLVHNKKLAEGLAEAKRHLLVSQDTEAALVKKINAYQKTVSALMSKFEDYVNSTSKSSWRLGCCGGVKGVGLKECTGRSVIAS